VNRTREALNALSKYVEGTPKQVPKKEEQKPKLSETAPKQLSQNKDSEQLATKPPVLKKLLVAQSVN